MDIEKENLYEGKDASGYMWISDLRYDDCFYLKDFEHLIVAKVVNFSESLPQEHWEAIIYEDETRSKIIGRQEFGTEQEAKNCIQALVEVILKNRKQTG